MAEKEKKTPQSSLYLRLAAGGYLLYLGWDLRLAAASNPLYWIPITLFAAIGLTLVVHSLRNLMKDYLQNKPGKKSDN